MVLDQSGFGSKWFGMKVVLDENVVLDESGLGGIGMKVVLDEIYTFGMKVVLDELVFYPRTPGAFRTVKYGHYFHSQSCGDGNGGWRFWCIFTSFGTPRWRRVLCHRGLPCHYAVATC